MREYFTSAEWCLVGFTGGVFFTLVVVSLFAAAILPDLVLRVRRRRSRP